MVGAGGTYLLTRESKRGGAPLFLLCPLPLWGRGYRPACHSPVGTAGRGWGLHQRKAMAGLYSCYQKSRGTPSLDIPRREEFHPSGLLLDDPCVCQVIYLPGGHIQ